MQAGPTEPPAFESPSPDPISGGGEDLPADSSGAEVPAPRELPPRTRALSLRANFSWTLAGNLTFAACQWGMITLLVKLGDPEVVGRLSMGLALTAPIFMLSNLQLRSLQATETTGTLGFADYAGVRLITTALALLASVIAALVGGLGAEIAWTVAGLGLSRAVDALSDVIHGDLQHGERMDLLAGSLMLRGLISVGALAAVYAWSGSLPWAVLAMAGGNLLVFLAFDLPNLVRTAVPELEGGERSQGARLSAEALMPRFDREAIRRILGDALPLGAVMMLISLNTNVPRYFIQGSLGDYTLGIFTPLAQLVAAGALVVNALGQSATPRLAKLYAAGELGAFRRLVWIMLGLAAILCCLGMALIEVAGAEILTLLYSAEYASYTPLLLLFAVLAGLQFAGSFVGYAMTSARRYRVQLPLFVGVGLVCLLGSYLLVPRFGLEGAVYALMASAVVQLAGSAWILAGSLDRMKIATAKR